MRTENPSVAIGVFEDSQRAQQSIHELKRLGFTDEQIGVAAKHDENLSDDVEHHGSQTGKGAGAGAAAGLGVGGLWGIGIAAGVLPGIGTAIAGGALASILASAAAGTAAGGLIGALIGLGIPKDEAEYYEQEFNRGRTIVTVRTDRQHNPGQFDEARRIFQHFGAYDVHSQRQAHGRD